MKNDPVEMGFNREQAGEYQRGTMANGREYNSERLARIGAKTYLRKNAHGIAEGETSSYFVTQSHIGGWVYKILWDDKRLH